MLFKAFAAFDHDDTGSLTCSELYGALRWMGLTDTAVVGPSEVLDMFEAADRDQASPTVIRGGDHVSCHVMPRNATSNKVVQQMHDAVTDPPI